MPLSRKQVLLMISSATLAGCGGTAMLMRSPSRSTLSNPGSATVICPPSACGGGGGGGGGGGSADSTFSTYGATAYIHAANQNADLYDPNSNYFMNMQYASAGAFALTLYNGSKLSAQMPSLASIPLDQDYSIGSSTLHFNSTTQTGTLVHSPSGTNLTANYDTNQDLVITDANGYQTVIPNSTFSPYLADAQESAGFVTAMARMPCPFAVILAFLVIVGIIIAALAAAAAACAGSMGIACIAAMIVLAAAAAYAIKEVLEWTATQCG
jgi:hypothetical protein